MLTRFLKDSCDIVCIKKSLIKGGKSWYFGVTFSLKRSTSIFLAAAPASSRCFPIIAEQFTHSNMHELSNKMNKLILTKNPGSSLYQRSPVILSPHLECTARVKADSTVAPLKKVKYIDLTLILWPFYPSHHITSHPFVRERWEVGSFI